MTDERKCENCQFWRRLEGKNNARGECYRYPPVPDLAEDGTILMGRFPLVYDTWWCGEFKAREDGGT